MSDIQINALKEKFRDSELNKIDDNMSDLKDFYVEVDGPNHSSILQKIAFEEGYGWKQEGQKVKHTTKNFLFFSLEGHGVWGGKEIRFSNSHPCRDVNFLENPTLEEFRQALRGNYWEDPIEIGEYEVKFKKNGIKVGCEYLSHPMIENIHKKWQNLNVSLTGVSLKVTISHPDVGEIPFEKIEAIYNRITD